MLTNLGWCHLWRGECAVVGGEGAQELEAVGLYYPLLLWYCVVLCGAVQYSVVPWALITLY